MKTDPVALLEELAMKWGDTADQCEERGLEADSIGLTVAANKADARADELRRCASELSAAIALMRAPVGEVTDAMLERALDAMRQGQYEGDQFRDSMRRALRAAMQQATKDG